jgi:hypothetical protein
MINETVLITGASAGIGAELARCFAADKCNLVLVARRRERLDELAAELRGKEGIAVLVVPADLARAEAPQQIFDKLSADNLKVDVLVNNAGFGALGPFDQLDAARQTEMVQVNVAALTHLTRLFLPGMVARGKGGMLNVASTAGFQAGPYMAVYYATKAYVISFTEALHDELAARGITVTCLCPGATTTEFAAAAKMEESRMFKLRPMTAEQVARIGYRGFRRGKLLVVAGWLNYFGAVGSRYAPRFVPRLVAKWLNT